MAYNSGIGQEFVKQLLVDKFTGVSTGDYKIALYQVGIVRDPLTVAAFDNAGELIADNYVAGGIPLSAPTITQSTLNGVPSILLTYSTVIVPNTTAMVEAYCIYEVATQKVFACGKFKDGTISSTNEALTITFAVGDLGFGFAG